MLLIFFSRPLFDMFYSPKPRDFSYEQARLDSLVALINMEKVNDSSAMPSLFRFDPNVATKNQLSSLGFKPYVVSRIINYREKGGRFRTKPDLLKIWGMDTATYERLLPFIVLPTQKSTAIIIRPEKAANNKKEESPFDLNSVDSTELLKIYGIGPVRAQRIIKFRESLGGFINKAQIFEVYGLDSVVVNRLLQRSFIREGFEPRKINVNAANENDLSAHPYLSKNEARAIVAYRFQHGDFTAVMDIRKIHNITDKTFPRIEPYLTVE